MMMLMIKISDYVGVGDVVLLCLHLIASSLVWSHSSGIVSPRRGVIDLQALTLSP